jgi:hypothetical protein
LGKSLAVKVRVTLAGGNQGQVPRRTATSRISIISYSALVVWSRAGDGWFDQAHAW